VQEKDNRKAILFSMTISYLTCLLNYYVPDIDLSNIATIFACFTYLSDLFAYYKMKTDFSNRDHKFTNPFGIPGAIFAACIFILTIIALVFYTTNYNTAYAVLVYLAILTVYYFAYAKKEQKFSEDEEKRLLTLHVVGRNRKHRKRIAAIFLQGHGQDNIIRKIPKRLWVGSSSQRSSNSKSKSSFNLQQQVQQSPSYHERVKFPVVSKQYAMESSHRIIDDHALMKVEAGQASNLLDDPNESNNPPPWVE
jgi:hypothetical protein